MVARPQGRSAAGSGRRRLRRPGAASIAEPDPGRRGPERSRCDCRSVGSRRSGAEDLTFDEDPGRSASPQASAEAGIVHSSKRSAPPTLNLQHARSLPRGQAANRSRSSSCSSCSRVQYSFAIDCTAMSRRVSGPPRALRAGSRLRGGRATPDPGRAPPDQRPDRVAPPGCRPDSNATHLTKR